MQHFCADLGLVPARRVRGHRPGAQSGAPRPRVQQLGTVHRDAVLSIRTRAIAAGNLRRTGGQRGQAAALGFAGSARPLNTGLCQRKAPLAVVPDRIPSIARQMRDAGARQAEEISLQEQADKSGRDSDRSVRRSFRLGQVQTDQGRGQAASAARSSGLFAVVCGDHGGKDA